MPRIPKIHDRIRNRRLQLGLRGRELAERAGISPSYVSLIEKGAKVPDEAVARRIAAILGDDEGLYSAWSRAARLGPEGLEQATRDLVNLRSMTLSPHARRMVERGTDLRHISTPAPGEEPAAPTASGRRRGARGKHAAASEKSAPRLSDGLPWRLGTLDADEEPEAPELSRPSAALVEVPVLPEGIDPDEVSTGHAVARDTLQLDAKLLPHSAEDDLFAYEVTPGDSQRLRGVASAGDLVILRRTWELGPGRIHAVRLRKRIVLSRVLFKKNALLLLPPDGSTQFDTIEVWGEKGLGDVVVGCEVLLIRR
jgi:transcriptional regulator with XRE-family HTH domain